MRLQSKRDYGISDIMHEKKKNYIKAHYCETLQPHGERGLKSFQNGGQKAGPIKKDGVKTVRSRISQHLKLETTDQYLQNSNPKVF